MTVDYLEGEEEDDYDGEGEEGGESDLEKTLVEDEDVGQEENADLQVVAPEAVTLDM